MRLGDLKDEREFNDNKILITILQILLVYTIFLILFLVNNEFNYLYALPYILLLVGYVVFSEYNDEQKQKNDIVYNDMFRSDLRFHLATKEAMDIF